MTFLIIRLLYITDKNSLEVNYNDSNMASYIKENYGSSHLSDDTKIDKFYKKIIEINVTVRKYITHTKIREEFYYLIHKLIMDNSPLIKNINLLLQSNELYKKYYNILFYKKSVNSKIVGSDMAKNYNELIKDLTNLNLTKSSEKVKPVKIVLTDIDYKDTKNESDQEKMVIVKPKIKKNPINYDDLKI
jgi:hypothetical protein